MDARDFLVTPFLFFVILIVAYLFRPHLTDKVTRRYFIPALTARMVGAIFLGLLYQFYYQGGDTFNYHTHGSRVIWEAFVNNPVDGIRLIFGSANNEDGIYQYTSRILFFHDPKSFFVIRVAGLFDLFTFSTYSATALLFSVVGFAGMWSLFMCFYRQYPHLHKGLVIATCFVPSVVFWGSGLLKDTIVIGCLGFATYYLHRIWIVKSFRISNFIILALSLFVIYSVRVFVLQAFLPAIIIWIIAYHFKSIQSVVLRMMVVPLMIFLLMWSMYLAVSEIGKLDSRYALENLLVTSQRTAYDIGFYTGREAGSGYSLDIASWTPIGLLRAAPAAINVSLFRPYIWEIRNPLMAISAVESMALFVFTIYALIRSYRHLLRGLYNYNIIFCSVFTLAYAFAAGVSTFNFGTLTRYRIIFLPFFVLALVLLDDYSKSRRKFSVLAPTE